VKRKLPEVDPDLLSRMSVLEAQMHTLKKKQKTDEKTSIEDLEEKMFNFDPNKVTLMSKDGRAMTYTKQPRLRDKDDESRMQRLVIMVAQLVRDNVKITNDNIRKLGFGTRIVNKWAKGVIEE